MGLFNSHKNDSIMAPQYLKILKDSANIINTTKKPDTFFERYALAEEYADKLCKLKGIKYTGDSPTQIKKQLANQKQAAIRKMVDRYYADTCLKMSKLKTQSAKQNKIINFITVLEDYFYLMNEENKRYVNKLYETGLNSIK